MPKNKRLPTSAYQQAPTNKCLPTSAYQQECRPTSMPTNKCLPATAYQQYTFARSKTSLNLNSFGGRNEVNNSHNSDLKVDRKTISPPRLDTKSESKIPARFLKRMQHATSLTEKPPSSGSTDRIMPSASESALKAKIEEAKLEHRNACKDAKNYEYHSKTLPTSSTSPYQRYVNIHH